MQCSIRMFLASGLVVGVSLTIGAPSASAQGGGLGGYGAMAGGSGMTGGGGAGTGLGAGTVAPFGGRFGAAMPSGMGGGGGLAFRPRPSATMSSSRTAFTIGPMGGGMSDGMGGGSGRRPFALPDLGSAGFLGSGVGMRWQMPATGGMGVMPPSFGYPFRQPPSLLTPSSPGTGMSM